MQTKINLTYVQIYCSYLTEITLSFCLISGVCVDENHAVLGVCTASSSDSLPTFLGILLVPSWRGDLENGISRYSWNVGNELPLLAA